MFQFLSQRDRQKRKLQAITYSLNEHMNTIHIDIGMFEGDRADVHVGTLMLVTEILL